ncbi:hypothetical protein PMSD_18290 [Paenibacillus macquariensis subsp. defensor]|nr:hypothetical protein PMSD_18290 [Paenibacillus macquariensis subsp. defensor]
MPYTLGECSLMDQLRKKGITPAEFARHMKCSRSFVSQLVSGKANMSLEFAINAAHYLDCRVNDLYALDWYNSENE